MKKEEFILKLILGGWVIKPADDDEDTPSGDMYINVDSAFEIHMQKDETVKLHHMGSYYGKTDFKSGFKLVNDNMILYQDLQNGT